MLLPFYLNSTPLKNWQLGLVSNLRPWDVIYSTTLPQHPNFPAGADSGHNFLFAFKI
jgi:hypothetical protein